ncbi:MAG: sigma-70 family RNA polymerase sigma factor [Dehalococcoidia bacterium]|nr:MAG: sigma-70 family RNA polymerase sigma factor [Dehalococcoidia bacterium]
MSPMPPAGDQHHHVPVAPPVPVALDQALAAARSKYLAFVRRRIADPDLAEDILQDALLRAIQSAPAIDDEDRLATWFYRVLRNAIIDTYRREAVRDRRNASLPEGFDVEGPDDAATHELCECFRLLLPEIRPEYGAVLQAVDLDETPLEAAAERLGITRNNLNVRRHRARQALRQRLEETCRLCADHGCLDCICGEPPA